MINYIIGKVVEKDENMLVVQANNIGYEIQVSSHTIDTLSLDSENVKILTYMQVKEDGISLFGFVSREEKAMFLKLIDVSGIGPKLAITILSNITISELVSAIINQDVKMLCTVKGLGKKTAERLLVELKDQTMPNLDVIAKDSINFNAIDQATDALVSLGVGKNEAYRLAKEYASEGATVEEIITNCLRGMGN